MTFFVKDCSRTMQARILIFGMHVDDDLLYREIGNLPSPAYSSLYLSNFLSIHTFKNEFFRLSSKISQEPCNLEGSCLVCRLMMTCCIVGLRTSRLLLIILYICPFFCPSIL